MRITFLAIVFVALGIFVPFWGFFLLAIVLASMQGGVLALVFAVLADVLFGPPVGYFHMIELPFTLFALFLLVGRYFLMRSWRRDVPSFL